MATKEYKLKGLTSLSISPGAKQEVEVEDIEGGKVLLVNAGGRIQALGAKCTHYGAPLAKGVLTSNGRLTCPWHGGICPHHFPSTPLLPTNSSSHSLLQRPNR